MPSITRAFFKKKWVPPLIWILISVIVYLSWGDGLDLIRKGAFAIVWDFLTFLIGLLVWLAFFAQFVLPVRTFRDRAKIFDRIMLYFTGRHGPAIYVKDGQVQSTWLLELEKEGPGVIWLDSASAAVTRTAAAYKQVLGPGVHFTDKDESLDQESVVDLHTQVQSLGPREKEKVFAPESDEESTKRNTTRSRNADR